MWAQVGTLVATRSTSFRVARVPPFLNAGKDLYNETSFKKSFNF